MSCKEVFTEEERKHLEEALHADLDGYWEEIKDVFKKDFEKSSAQEQVDNILQKDFMEWKDLSNGIFKKCDLNEWNVPPVFPLKKITPLKEAFKKAAEKERERKEKIAKREH